MPRAARSAIIVKLESPRRWPACATSSSSRTRSWWRRRSRRGDAASSACPPSQKQSILSRAAWAARDRGPQMLESMIEHSRPTRAEALRRGERHLDGRRTRSCSPGDERGSAPDRGVQVMSRIIEATESGALESMSDRRHRRRPRSRRPSTSRPWRAAQELQAAAVRMFTQTGVPCALSRSTGRSAAPRVHDGARVRQPAHARVGRRDVHRACRRAHRRDGAPGRARRSSTSGGEGGRPGRHRRRHAPGVAARRTC